VAARVCGVWLQGFAAAPAFDINVPQPGFARTEQLADAILGRHGPVNGLGCQFVCQYLRSGPDGGIRLPEVLAARQVWKDWWLSR